MKNLFSKIDDLVALRSIFRGSIFEQVQAEAFEQNPWFTPEMVDRAANSICTQMLSSANLRAWLSNYEHPSDFRERRVGIIAAGNIPMVGFFDLLSAVIAGHAVSFKPSSKDRPLMEYIALQMPADIEIVKEIDRYDIDFLIATGSSTTADAVVDKYKGIPSVIRGTRHSLAQITGNETQADIAGLNDDLFLYFGLGCRNISHLFLPRNYDITQLATQLHPYHCTAFDSKVNYQHAIYTMRDEPHTLINGFILKELSANEIPPVGVVGYSFYDTQPQFNNQIVQCTVGMPQNHTNTPFGTTQTPTLTQFPDNIDILNFLLS